MFGKMTCFPVSKHLSISIYTLELEKKSSVTGVVKLGLTFSFRLFLNAQLTFSPIKISLSCAALPAFIHSISQQVGWCWSYLYKCVGTGCIAHCLLISLVSPEKSNLPDLTCFLASTHVSIPIYTRELEKKSSVAVTFTLLVNARLTFSPVKHPHCALVTYFYPFSIPMLKRST